MKRVKPAPLPPYRHTHYSVGDGSPAMLLWQSHQGTIGVFMNEDGHTWSDRMDLWTTEPVVTE